MAEEVTNFELLLTRGRALRIGFLVAEQVPSELCRAARVSCHLVVAFGTNGTELRTAAELLGLREPRQIERLQSLGRGECIMVMTGGRFPGPLVMRTALPQIDRRPLTVQERAEYLDRALKEAEPAVRPRFAGFLEQRRAVKQRERDPNRLSRIAYWIFAQIADYPFQTIQDRCTALNIDLSEEGAYRKECMIKGYVAEAGTVGRGIKLFELTPKGRDFADRHNVPVRSFKSGVVHEYLLRQLMRGLAHAGISIHWCSPAGATGTKQPDGYGLLPDGRAICLQIHYRNKVAYELNRLADLCSIDHVDLVLLVAATKKAQRALQAAIADRQHDPLPKRYVLLNATECLDPDFGWARIFETSENAEV